MFEPNEISEPVSKFALHVVKYGKEIKIQKIPLLEVINNIVEDEKAFELFIEPISDHHAYLVNDILKVSLKFPREIKPAKYQIDNNIMMYNRINSLKMHKDLNFQIVPIWHSVNWPYQLFHLYNPTEFMIYHPTWEKEYLADMVRYHNTTTMRSIAQFIENDAFE